MGLQSRSSKHSSVINEINSDAIPPVFIHSSTIRTLLVFFIDLEIVFMSKGFKLIKSIRKTNKVVIVEECMKTGGIAAELISLITEECFDDLDCRPIRLSSQDIPTPYNGNLENLTIIQPHQIVEKVKQMVNGSI